MALPKLLDDLVTKRIVEAVRAGASRTAAAEAARVARSTLHLWLQRGADGEEPYAGFAMKVREAEGELEQELLSIIKKHSVNSWQAAAWILERKFQRRWAIRRHVEREEKGAAGKHEVMSYEEQLSIAESLVAAVKSQKDER